MPHGLTMAKGPIADIHHQMIQGFRRLAAEEYDMPEQSVKVAPFEREVQDATSGDEDTKEKVEIDYEVPPPTWTNTTPPTVQLAKTIKEWFHNLMSESVPSRIRCY